MSRQAPTAGKPLRVTLVKSIINTTRDQRATTRSLGLRRIRQEVELPDTPVVRGMLHKVRHLIRIEEEGTV
jgi:large subunit ribosomal protein L30